MKRSYWHIVVCFIAILFSLGFSIVSPTGYISGMIKDPAGAPFPGVQLTLINAATGARRTAVSDASGGFQFSQLEPARWMLTAEATGCKRVSMPVLVQVDQVTTVQIAMQLGKLTEIVEVTDAITPLFEKGKSTTSAIKDDRLISSLPLNGRQFLDLALLTPGVIPASPGAQGNGFNSAGARSQSNVYLLDGISNQDTQQNDALNQFRITDAVQEFAVQTSVQTAEFGRGSGAQVNVVTRSGSNQFHGSVFEYFRNTGLNAADFFTNKLGGEKTVLNRNQFGATLGGPIFREHTFFFVSYEGFRQVAPAVRSTRVPTAAERITVTDAISKRLLEYWPLPNATGTVNYIANVRNDDDDDTGSLRIDHRLSQHDQLSGRWTEYHASSFVGGTTLLTGGNQGEPLQRSIMLGHTHIFSSRFLNEFRLGYSRNEQERRVQDFGLSAGTIFIDANGKPLAGVIDATKDPLNSGLPSIAVGGGYAALGTNINMPQGRISSTTELFENISLSAPLGWTAHSWRWGFHIRREDLRRYLNRASRGAFNFANFADFGRGQLNASNFRTGSTLAYWRRYPWDLYWQDEFKVRENLTLNFGVRYEYPSAVEELRGHATNFVPGVGPVVVGSNRILSIDPTLKGPAAITFTTASFELPASGVYSDKNNVAPMFGFAYSPRIARKLFGVGDTVIRGGVRIAYDDLFNNVPSSMALGPPYNLQVTQTANVTQPGKFAWAIGFDQNVPLVSNFGKQGPGTPTVGVLSFQGVDPNLRSAYLYQYNFGIQRRLSNEFSIEADYQGSSGHRLGVFIDVNQPTVIVRDPARRGPVAPNEQVFPYPSFGNMQIAKSIGNSSYNGLVLTAKYQNRQGIFLRTAYTFGKSLDYNSGYFGSNNPPGEAAAPVDARNLRLEHGPSAFDIRHRFNLVYVIPLPIGPGHKLFGWKNAVSRLAFADWQISGVATLQSGYPFTVTTGGQDTSGFNQVIAGGNPAGGNRPDLARPGKLPQDNRNPDAAFDPSWFVSAFAGRVGTSGRNQYYGPGLYNHDFAIAKNFPLVEQAHLQFRADFFNLFNHTNFANPISDLSNANFGKITQTLGAAVSNAVGTTGGPIGGPRLIQFSLRVQF
ncbi:MAG: carboxypeptidase regulatory-like domain-containing protein [Acidobacteria bacterium]|nr:carboxypeptidase regulatory-like domain-containing protein [Acidobacteriota bacterium]